MIGSNTIVKTQRRAITEGSKNEFPSGVYELENVQALIQPASAELAAMLDIENAFSVFNMACDNVDIVKNDLVIDTNGNEYLVNGVKAVDDPVDSHLELVIVKSNS